MPYRRTWCLEFLTNPVDFAALVAAANEQQDGALVGRGAVAAALRLRRVVRLERALRRERDPGPRPLGGHGRGKARGPASDHEHVDMAVSRHSARTIPDNAYLFH